MAGLALKCGSAQKLKQLADHYSVNCDDASLALGLRLIGDNEEDAFVNTRSCSFDGVNEYITVGDVSELQFESTDAWSASIWFKTSYTGVQYLFAKRQKQTNWPYTYRGYSLAIRSGDIKFDKCNGTSSSALEVRSYTTAGQYADGNWHNIVVTDDGSGNASGIQFYMDGVAMTMTTIWDTLGSNTIITNEPFQWGVRGSALTSFQGYWNGYLDEGSVWSKELSGTEVVEMQNDGVVGDLLDHSAAAALVHWLRFGDTENYPTLFDGSVNSNDGTMVNMEDADIAVDAPA